MNIQLTITTADKLVRIHLDYSKKLIKMNDWKSEKLTKIYLEGIRGAIPFAKEQIDLLIRIVRYFQPDVKSFLDLGAGDGILGRAVFANWPDSKGVFLDYSEPMIIEAKFKCGDFQNSARFIIQDFGEAGWADSIADSIPVDLVISGFSIHHQDDSNKKRIYNEIYHRILKPGGLFLNMEHVASQSADLESIFDGLFIDYLTNYHKTRDSNTSREKIADEYYNREDKKLNILAPVEDQCDWLREIGFINVDCYFKVFELSIFGGVKPISMEMR